MNKNDLWTAYKSTGERQYRDQLILAYEDLVRYAANKVSSNLPNTVEYDDLVSYGMFGLIDAIEKFEPERGFKFETYAMTRIKGSILDEIRSMDWVPRSIRARNKQITKTKNTLELELQRPVSTAEIAAALDTTEDQVRIDTATSYFVTLDDALTAQDDEGMELSLKNVLAGEDHDLSEVAIIAKAMADATETVTDRERFVLTLYYYYGLTLADIGTILGVTESRICQIHTKAISQLRENAAA
jgi:RNA polymerase sigma factor for flagellar operon FliA